MFLSKFTLFDWSKEQWCCKFWYLSFPICYKSAISFVTFSVFSLNCFLLVSFLFQGHNYRHPRTEWAQVNCLVAFFNLWGWGGIAAVRRIGVLANASCLSLLASVLNKVQCLSIVWCLLDNNILFIFHFQWTICSFC